METGQGVSGGVGSGEAGITIAGGDASTVAARGSDFVPTSSTTGACETYTVASHSQAPVQPTATRWSSRRNGGRNTKAQEREDVKKQRKMRIDKFDDFVEWMDGDASLRYHPKDSDARKHLSGWAMRNTNNHNKKVLKKSCLGVYICNRSCRSPNGDIVTIRPATSDRARRKQADKKCPRPGCEGKLYHVACTGKNGYPVTHFWRVTDSVIIFQSKGRHDHPRPDVVKTPSVAKMALFEYHRTHKHERPKDICKRMGVHIHKSFSRVDRVARQLREVQTVLAKDDKGADKKPERTPANNHGYSLRSPLTRMWASHHKMGTSENHQPARPGLTIPAGGIRHNSLNTGYSEQPQYETWPSNYYQQQHSLPAADYQHGYAGYTAQLPSDYYHGGMYAGYQLSSTGTITYDSGMDMEYGAQVPSKSEAMPEGSRMTELTVMKESPEQTMASLNGALKPVSVRSNPLMQHGHEGVGNLEVGAVSYPGNQLVDNSSLMSTGRHALKRSLPPALHHIDAKQAKTEPLGGLEPHTPSKLADQTPSINMDMSSFSDIFDISASLGDEGLAGRPKTPVFHAPSPPLYESPQKPTGAAMPGGETAVMSPSSAKGEAAPSPQTSLSVNVVNSPSPAQVQPAGTGTESTLASPSGFKYRQVIHHSPSGPVLTQLSTHPHQTSSNPVEDENGTYIDFLVSMYLKDSEKPISTLKNELHVYTERNSQKGLAFCTEQGLQFAPHLKSPSSSQFDFSWYDMDRRSQHFRSPQAAQPSLLSPLNIAGPMDYAAPYIKDVLCTDQASDSGRVMFMRNINAQGNSLNRHVY